MITISRDRSGKTGALSAILPIIQSAKGIILTSEGVTSYDFFSVDVPEPSNAGTKKSGSVCILAYSSFATKKSVH